MVQGFLAHLLARPFLRGIACEKGKFRSFLLASLQNFLADQRDRAGALKRGAGQPMVSFDSEEAAALYASEPANTLSPDKLLDRRWAMTLLERTQSRLRCEYAAAGKGELYEKLRQFNIAGEGSPAYREVASQLGILENTLKSLVHRMRQRYRELLREEVAQTVSTTAEVDDEIRYLLQAASS
jgi:RNA polymerase sigma-70 factor (ECF subfamily)